MSEQTVQDENQEQNQEQNQENDNTPLTQDTEHLFRRLRGPVAGIRNNDPDALRDHLVLVHAPLVEYCARGFISSGEPVEDLVQEGYIGLVKAVDRYDPDKGIKFSTYACHLISGEIRHYLRDLGRLIHEPGWHSELRQRITRTTEKLTTEFDRTPTPEEIAESLDIKVDSVREVLKNAQVLNVDSLEDKRRDDDDASDWSEQISDDESSHEEMVEHQMVLRAALPQLKELEKRAVTMFFFQEKSKTEIAREMGISINYAAYLVKRGLENLRQIIESSEAASVTPHISSSFAQQKARASYLFELAKGPLVSNAADDAGSERRRTNKKLTTVPALSRKRIANLVEFAGYLDEEVLRAARYDHEFGLLWLQIPNWAEATANLGTAAASRAASAVQKLARRSCRSVDKLAVAPPHVMPGLNLFLLLPHSGPLGARVGERWLALCSPENVCPHNPEEIGTLQLKMAFVLFPLNGKSADELFENLGEKMKA